MVHRIDNKYLAQFHTGAHKEPVTGFLDLNWTDKHFFILDSTEFASTFQYVLELLIFTFLDSLIKQRIKAVHIIFLELCISLINQINISINHWGAEWSAIFYEVNECALWYWVTKLVTSDNMIIQISIHSLINNQINHSVYSIAINFKWWKAQILEYVHFMDYDGRRRRLLIRGGVNLDLIFHSRLFWQFFILGQVFI